jgi:hypothetical protein
MTEAEWLKSTNPREMLAFLRDQVSDRKLRLFACACCRRIWHLLVDERSRSAVEVAEGYADGLQSRRALASAVQRARRRAESVDNLGDDAASYAACWAGTFSPDAILECAWAAADAAAFFASAKAAGVGEDALSYYTGLDAGVQVAEPAAQARLLRDIIGNPFRPVAIDPAWLTPQVVAVARAVYKGRQWDELAVLADALQEAGCSSADLLAHLRSGGEHVRGCWALDLILGRE